MTTRLGLSGSEATLKELSARDIKVEQVPIAGSSRGLDGTLNTDYVAYKLRWTVAWTGLTSTQRDAIAAEVTRLSNLSWYPPTGSNYTVKVNSANWSIDNYTHYRYDLVLEQV